MATGIGRDAAAQVWSRLKLIFAKPAVAQIGTALLTSLILRRLGEGFFLQILQMTIMLIIAIAFLPFMWIQLQHFTGGWLFRSLCFGLAMITLIGLLCIFSLVSHKPISPDDIIIDQTLNEMISSISRESKYNTIKVEREVEAGFDHCFNFHAYVPLEWRRLDLGLDRMYECQLHFKGTTRMSTDGKYFISALELIDYSITPKQGEAAYLFGWVEAPFLITEVNDFSGRVYKVIGSQLNNRLSRLDLRPTP